MAAGIVVVASAGNDGANDHGRAAFSAASRHRATRRTRITVGAVNTWGTATAQRRHASRRTARAVRRGTTSPSSPTSSRPATRSFRSRRRGSLAARRPTRSAQGGHGDNELHAAERHEHGGADGQRRGRAAAARHTGPRRRRRSSSRCRPARPTCRDGGLMGAGAGSVNFWASRQIAANGFRVARTRDARRRPAQRRRAARRSGTRARLRTGFMPARGHPAAVGLLDLSSLWANPSLLQFGRSEPRRPAQSAASRCRPTS